MKEILKVRVFDFAEYPGPRYIKQGLDSGEQFYNEFIKTNFKKALTEKKKLLIDLDFTAGYAPSFIDEIFGNLIYDFDFEDIKSNILIKSEEEPHWESVVIDDIWPKWFKKKEAGEPRKPKD